VASHWLWNTASGIHGNIKQLKENILSALFLKFFLIMYANSVRPSIKVVAIIVWCSPKQFLSIIF
jgi:hypothetical protein